MSPRRGQGRRRSQTLPCLGIVRQPLDKSAQCHQRTARTFGCPIGIGHLKQRIVQSTHCRPGVRRGSRAARKSPRPFQPVTGLQVFNQVPARSVRCVEPSKRRRLIGHFGVGLDKRVTLEAADTTRLPDSCDRAGGVQARANSAVPQSEPPFGENCRHLGESCGLAPQRRPDFPARAVRVGGRQAACSGVTRFKREWESGSNIACGTPTPRERTGEHYGSFHCKHDIPRVERTIALVSGRCVRSTLPRTELTHRSGHVEALVHAEQRRLEWHTCTVSMGTVVELEQFLQTFRKVDPKVAATVVTSRTKQRRRGFIRLKDIAGVQVSQMMRVGRGPQGWEQETLGFLRLPLDTFQFELRPGFFVSFQRLQCLV